MDAKGNKIKSALVYRYPKFFLESVSDAEDGKGFLEQKLVYDANGNVLFDAYYSESNILEHKIERIFDDKELLKSELLYYSEDEVAEEMNLERDSKNKIVKKIKKYAEGGNSYSEYTYNDAGLLVEITTNDDEGDIEEQQIIEYSGELIIKKTIINSYNEVESIESFIYDSESRVIEHVSEDSQNYELLKRIYDGELLASIEIYDKSGNGLKKYDYVYNEEKLLSEIRERGKMGSSFTKFNYDEHGNDILEELYIGESLIQRVKREYDEHRNVIMTAFWNENKEYGVINSYTQISIYEYL